MSVNQDSSTTPKPEPSPPMRVTGSARGRAILGTVAGTGVLLVGWLASGAMMVSAQESAELSLVRSRDTSGLRSGAGLGSYDAVLGPEGELHRVVVTLEHAGARDEQLEPLRALARRGRAELHLDTRSLPPGVLRIRAEIDRRGDRSVAVSDDVVLGPFATRTQSESRCNVALGVSARAIRGALLPRLREELEGRLKDVDALGADPKLERLDVHLVDGGVRVEVAVAAADRLAIDAVLDLAAAPPRQIGVSLRSLDKVVFEGKTRDRAETGAAVVGAVLTGPLAPAGAELGRKWMGDYVSKKAREIATQRIEEGLRAVSELELVPEGFEALRGDPRSHLDIALCGPLILGPTELGIGLRATPRWPSDAQADANDPSDGREARDANDTTRRDGIPGPIFYDAPVVPLPLRDGEDVRVDVGIDGVNALLWSWTQSGLLSDLIHSRGLLENVNRELEPWTTIRAGELHVVLPPIVMVDARDPSQWRMVWSAIELALAQEQAPAPGGSTHAPGSSDSTPDPSPRRPGAQLDPSQRKELALTFAGRLAPVWQRSSGELLLTGHLDDLAIRCERREGDKVRVEPCLSQLLAALDLRKRIDDRLAPDAGRLPAIHLGPLLQRATRGDASIAWLHIEHPKDDPTRIRIQAGLELEPGLTSATIEPPEGR